MITVDDHVLVGSLPAAYAEGRPLVFVDEFPVTHGHDYLYAQDRVTIWVPVLESVVVVEPGVKSRWRPKTAVDRLGESVDE